MILYSTNGCPQCRFLKQKLDTLGISYAYCDNPENMPDLNSLPAIETETGKIMYMREALQYVSNLEGGVSK